MKQVIFAIALLAMASLTGCLTDDESTIDETTDTTSDNTGNTNDNSNDNSDTNQDNTDSGDDGLIDPVGTDGGYTPPTNSNVMLDYGVRGYWTTDQITGRYQEFYECTEQGWFTYYRHPTDEPQEAYCDLDFKHNQGPQLWINKTGNTVTIECIKQKSFYNGQECKGLSFQNGERVAYLLFTSKEGFSELIRVPLRDIAQISDDNEHVTYFFKSEVVLKFEPIKVSAEYSTIEDLYLEYRTDTVYF